MRFALIAVLALSVSSVFAAPSAKPAARPMAAPAPAPEHRAAPSSSLSPNQGSDSCGLGWQVTNSRSFLGTTTRGTTNYFVPPSFGMTSGTLGCETHTFAKEEQKAVDFVAQNGDSLKADLAVGNGEYLSALSETMGCASSSSVVDTLRSHSAELIKSDGVELYKNIRSVIRSNAAVASSCSVSA